MRALIVAILLLAAAPAVAQQQPAPAFTPDELKKLDMLLDAACTNTRRDPSLACAREALALLETARTALSPDKKAEPKPAMGAWE